MTPSPPTCCDTAALWNAEGHAPSKVWRSRGFFTAYRISGADSGLIWNFPAEFLLLILIFPHGRRGFLRILPTFLAGDSFVGRDGSMRDGRQMPEYLTFLVVGLIRLRLRASPSRMKCIICDDPVIQRRVRARPSAPVLFARMQAGTPAPAGRAILRRGSISRPPAPPLSAEGLSRHVRGVREAVPIPQQAAEDLQPAVRQDPGRSNPFRECSRSQYATMRALRCAIPAGQPNAKQLRAGHVQRFCSVDCFRASRAPRERTLPAAA